MTTEKLVLLMMIVLFVGMLPSWSYSRGWGYAPSGVLMLLLVGFVVWSMASERPLFKSSGKDVKASVQDAGNDLKAAGRDVADSIRDVTK